MEEQETEILPDRFDTLAKVMEIIYSNTVDPADSLIAQGRCLMQIGEALKGMPPQAAVATMQSAYAMIRVTNTPDAAEGEG